MMGIFFWLTSNGKNFTRIQLYLELWDKTAIMKIRSCGLYAYSRVMDYGKNTEQCKNLGVHVCGQGPGYTQQH